MSSRKGFTPKYTNTTSSSFGSTKGKGATGSTTKGRGATGCARKLNTTPRNLNQTDLNLKKGKESVTSVLNATAAPDGTPSQRFMQHKLDMAYNKYLQNLALHSILNRLHREYEISLAEQLLHYEQLYKLSVEEEQNSKYLLSQLKKIKDVEKRMQFLEKSLDNIVCVVSDKTLVAKITKFNSELQVVCNKFKLENEKFVENAENYEELHRVLNEILLVFDFIKSESHLDLVMLAENIFKIFELLKTLRQNHETVVEFQTKANQLVLQVASMELS